MKKDYRYDALYKREAIFRERYENQIATLSSQINLLQNKIKEQELIIGNLRQEMKYKDSLIERLNSYNSNTKPKKSKFWQKLFKRRKSL